MKFERSNVQFPLWRKKVDYSIFEENGTAIPDWVCMSWNLHNDFPSISGRVKENIITIIFEDQEFEGWITSIHPKRRKNKAYRLFYDPELSNILSKTFTMSYMRSLEAKLRDSKNIETEIPFWEFLDIEYDKEQRICHLTAYYIQTPAFAELFKRMAGSPALMVMQDQLLGKSGVIMRKSKWKARKELDFEIGAKNVIYTLVDTKNKLLYIGEAEDLQKRVKADRKVDNHPTIVNWDKYRYGILPSVGNKKKDRENRISIERMLISDLASLLQNDKIDDTLDISEYRLVNAKIDRN